VEILSFEVTEVTEVAPRELGRVPGSRTPRWLKLGLTALAVSGLVGVLVVFIIGLERPHEGQDGRGEAASDAEPVDETRLIETDEIFGLSAQPQMMPLEAGDGSATFRVMLLDGTEVTVPLTPRSTSATVSLSGLQASLGLVSEACCARRVAVFNAPPHELFAGVAEHNAPDLADVGGVRVFDGPAHRQLLALDALTHTVVVAAEPNRPFTPAELVSIRDLVRLVVDGAGNMKLEARLPLDVRLPAESNVATIGYSDPAGRRAVAVVAAACADPAGGFDTPRCSVRHCPAIVRLVPAESDAIANTSPQAVGASGGSCALHDTSLQRKTADEKDRAEDRIVVVAGSGESGLVIAVDQWTGRMIWAALVGETAHIMNLVDDGVLVAAAPGRSVFLDIYTGAVRWTAG
jgi:hypothetical protein